MSTEAANSKAAESPPKRKPWNRKSKKSRWVQVGRLFAEPGSTIPDVKLSGTISLGVFGEIQVRLNSNETSRGKNEEGDLWIDLYAPADALPLNQLRKIFGVINDSDE